MSQPQAQYRLVRPDDHLELLVIAERLSERPREGGGRELVANAKDLNHNPLSGFLSIQIQPQQAVEWAGGSTTPPDPQPRPIFGDFTTVRFIVPAQSKVPLTVDGVLAALRTLKINGTPAPSPFPDSVVAPPPPSGAELLRRSRATARGGADPLLAERVQRASAWFPSLTAPRVSEEDIAPPQPLLATTELHFPSRLVMGLTGAVGFDHAAQPATRDGRVELWHTRLKQRSNNALVQGPTQVTVIRTQELAAGDTSAWATRVGDGRVKGALRDFERNKLAQQVTSQTPATAQRLELSALGAWLDLEWQGPDLSWQHRLAQGRDQYVRIASVGQLYPLGHKALLVKETERVWPKRNGQAAFLHTKTTIYVLERSRAYPAGDKLSRAWPWQEVRILTPAATGDHEDVMSGVSLMMTSPAGPRVPFEWECVGKDRAGRVTRFELPMYFVAGDFQDFAGLELIFLNNNGSTNHGGAPFRTIKLAGQTVALAPVAGGAPDAADMVVSELRLTPPSKLFAQQGPVPLPAVEHFVGELPALQQLVPGAGAATVKFAAPYLANGFGAGNLGEALLELAPATRPKISLAGDTVTGGLVAPRFTLTGISRKFGPVGGLMSEIASGKFTPQSFFKEFIDEVTLLGVFKLSDLLGPALERGLEQAPQLTTRGHDGFAEPRVSWSTDLPNEVTAEAPLAKGTLRARREGDVVKAAKLNLLAETKLAQAANVTRTTVTCEVLDVELAFSLENEELLVVPIRNMTFTSVDGGKLDVDVNLGAIQFKGVLAFIKTLADLIPEDGFHDPPALDVHPDGVTSSFSLPLPPVAAGVFVLENIALHSRLDLFFAGEPAPSFELAFARPESPFRVTVTGLGGGGWIAIKVATNGFQQLAGALEFGAAVSVNLGVARGSVSAMGGLAFFVDGDGKAGLTAYFTVRGELRVLGLISISVEVTLALGYESPPARLFGKAVLAVKVKCLFVSKTVKLEFEKTFAGADGGPSPGGRALAAAPPPPTFADLMGGAAWDSYCLSYAEEDA